MTYWKVNLALMKIYRKVPLYVRTDGLIGLWIAFQFNTLALSAYIQAPFVPDLHRPRTRVCLNFRFLSKYT